MKHIIFDGRAFARKKEDKLYHKIARLGKTPTMATVIVGDDPASKLYVRLKREAAERIGAEMDVYEFPKEISKEDLILKIDHLNQDPTLDGIMIQLPLPGALKEHTEHIIHHISKEKDVDGLRDDSPFVPATVHAVVSILDEAKRKVGIAPDAYIAVVGAGGEVGSKLVEILSKSGYEVGGLTRNMDKDVFGKELASARVVISATGSPGLIKREHISKGAIVIDVGSPRGDVDPLVRDKASFVTPVPGGVGPVTVVSLMENLTEAALS